MERGGEGWTMQEGGGWESEESFQLLGQKAFGW